MGETTKKPYYKSDICEVSRMENETGDGISTAFRVFLGIYLLHSDFHMQECPTVKMTMLIFSGWTSAGKDGWNGKYPKTNMYIWNPAIISLTYGPGANLPCISL